MPVSVEPEVVAVNCCVVPRGTVTDRGERITATLPRGAWFFLHPETRLAKARMAHAVNDRSERRTETLSGHKLADRTEQFPAIGPVIMFPCLLDNLADRTGSYSGEEAPAGTRMPSAKSTKRIRHVFAARLASSFGQRHDQHLVIVLIHDDGAIRHWIDS